MNNLLRAFLLPLAIGGIALGSYAVPAKPGIIQRQLPDGTTLNVRLFGDENHHFLTTEDGYLIIEKDNRFYYADIDSEGRTINSGIRAVNIALRNAEAQKFLSGVDMNRVRATMTKQAVANKEKRSLMATARPQKVAPQRKGYGLFAETTFPSMGEQKALVILVEYSDVSMTLSNAHDYFSRLLSEPGFSDYGGTGSAADYFTEVSNGQFIPQFDVYGPVKLPNKRSYYGGNNWYGDDKKPAHMIADACRLLDDQINFADYDRDGDGYVDNIFVFYAGTGEASGGPEESVWPHSWTVEAGLGYSPKYDGVYLSRYACSNEWQASGRPDGIGTFVHEFSHVMGLPDLYATRYTDAFTPGDWSVLDYGPYNNNSCTPPLYGAFERYALGWMEPTEVSQPANATLPPIGENKAGIIRTAKDTEFFLLENRQKTGWDKYIPGHGMLVWHVDYNADVWTQNAVNNTASHQYVDIEEADGSKSDYSRAGDAFPGTSNKTSFTDTTNPNMETWSGVALNKPLTDIAENNGIITFKICGGREEAIPEVDNTEAAEQTEDGFIASWDVEDENLSYLLTVYVDAENAAEIPAAKVVRLNVDGQDGDYVALPQYNRLNVGKANSYTVTGIDSSKQHYFTIIATDGWEESAESPRVAVFDLNNVSISSVDTDTASAEVYYNLQGIRIERPETGIYLVRKNGKVKKVIIK